MKLSDNEIAVYKGWLLNKKNKDIAQEMGVSESYISQTIKELETKVSTIKDSLAVLEEIGAIDPITPIKIAGKNRRSTKKPSDKQSNQSLNLITEDYKAGTRGIEGISSPILDVTPNISPSLREFKTLIHSTSNTVEERKDVIASSKSSTFSSTSKWK
jgi:hypothetical protein